MSILPIDSYCPEFDTWSDTSHIYIGSPRDHDTHPLPRDTLGIMRKF